MSTKYLDSTGLTYLWGKLKAYFQPKLVSGTNIKTINNQTLLGSGNISISGGGGTSDYDQLSNRPQINSVTLTGDKSSADIGVADASHTHTVSDITDMSDSSGHIQIGAIHICWGYETFTSTANSYKEVQVSLPYTYSSAPTVFTSTANRSAQVRTTYGTQGALAGNKIYLGAYATAARSVTVCWLTIGV